MKLSLLAILFFAGCKHQDQPLARGHETKSQIESMSPAPELYELKAQVIGKLKSGQNLYWGGFSGLQFIEKDATGDLYFWTITDRGPNGAEFKIHGQAYRPFLAPDFHPSLVKIRANKVEKDLEVIESIPLKNSTGEFMTGLPPANSEGTLPLYEIPVNEAHEPISNSFFGVDTESLAIDSQKNFWAGEEYEPSLLQFDPQGTLITQIKPAPQAREALKRDQLPYEYRYRKLNRGFEAIGYFNDRIYMMLQSPLDVPLKPMFIRIGVFNIKTHFYEAEYLYPIDDSKVDKIGDLQMVSQDQFWVIEQNGEVGPAAVHKIYEVNLANATNTLKAGLKKYPEALPPREFPSQFKFASKSLLIDLVQAGYSGFDKVEGLTRIDANTIAVVNDNDFGVVGSQITKTPTVLGLLKIP